MNPKDFITGMLGEISPASFLHAFAWAMVGATISLLLNIINRDVMSSRSPVHFSWYFMLRDNFNRILIALLLIIVTLRFAPDIIGVQLSGWIAVLVGFGHDKLAQILKNKRDAFFNTQTGVRPSIMKIGYPTIDVNTDIIDGTSDLGALTPATGAQLAISDSRFSIEQDEDGNDILCAQKADSAPFPTITGTDSSSNPFLPQPAEGFIGPRPPHYRPR